MNEFERSRRACHLSIKACQNLQAAYSAFGRLFEIFNSDDHLLISSVFHAGVIRYAKPFLNSDSGNGLVSFPVKSLKKVQGFSTDIHKHLINIRHTLIAHDDFREVTPRILFSCFKLRDSDEAIPISIVVSNKCISHPNDTGVVQKFIQQAFSAFTGAQQKLADDIDRLRNLAILYPEQAANALKYSKKSNEEQLIPKEGDRLNTQDFMSDEWLNIKEPNFSEIHDGFCYEEIKLKRDFHGPETIKLSNGYTIEILPS